MFTQSGRARPVRYRGSSDRTRGSAVGPGWWRPYCLACDIKRERPGDEQDQERAMVVPLVGTLERAMVVPLVGTLACVRPPGRGRHLPTGLARPRFSRQT